jgi:hypothetical protein
MAALRRFLRALSFACEVNILRKINRRDIVLLYEAHVRDGIWFRNFANGTELRFIAADIFAERPQDALGMRRGHDHAGNQLALRHIWKHIDEVRRKLIRIMVEHHQIAELSD